MQPMPDTREDDIAHVKYIIGTLNSRLSSIMESIYKRGYMNVKKRRVYITQKGMDLMMRVTTNDQSLEDLTKRLRNWEGIEKEKISQLVNAIRTYFKTNASFGTMDKDRRDSRSAEMALTGKLKWDSWYCGQAVRSELIDIVDGVMIPDKELCEKIVKASQKRKLKMGSTPLTYEWYICELILNADGYIKRISWRARNEDTYYYLDGDGSWYTNREAVRQAVNSYKEKFYSMLYNRANENLKVFLVKSAITSQAAREIVTYGTKGGDNV